MQESPRLRRTFFLAGLAGIVLLTALTAAIQYRSNSRRLIHSRQAVEDTRKVLAALQIAEQSIQQNIADAALFRATGLPIYQIQRDQEKARFSQSATEILLLVQHDTNEEGIARELITDFNRLDATSGSGPSGPMTSTDPWLRVSREVQQLQTTEQNLLQARLAAANRQTGRSIRAVILFLGITIAISIALFLLLWRSALNRRLLQIELEQANQKLQKTSAKMRRSAELSAIPAAAAEELQICIEQHRSYQIATRFFAELAPHSSGVLALIDDSRQMVDTVSLWGDIHPFLERFPIEACCALRTRRERWHLPATNEVHCSHHAFTAPPEYYFCLPLSAHGELLGSVLIQFASMRDFSDAHQHRKELREVGEMVALAIANLKLRQSLRDQAVRDGLTGLFNRRFLEIAFERELHRAKRHKMPISIFMIDVDHLKQLNDNFGRETGDAVLRELAQVIHRSVRSEDIVCRYGGEEFLIILPEMSRDVALDRAEALRQLVEQMHVPGGEQSLHQVTISIGISTYPYDGTTQEDLLEIADKNLFRSKRQGRNRSTTNYVPSR